MVVHMKLPRWLVVTMLATSTLALLAFAGWWWVTWPERTFAKFKSLIAAGKFDEANALVTNPDHVVNYARFSGKVLQGAIDDLFVAESQSPTDVLTGERRWRMQNTMNNIALVVSRSTMRVVTPEGFHWTFVLLVE